MVIVGIEMRDVVDEQLGRVQAGRREMGGDTGHFSGPIRPFSYSRISK